MLDLILTAVVYGILVLITLDAYFAYPEQTTQREGLKKRTPSLHR